jgi:ketosteroid isomerase-like protein
MSEANKQVALAFLEAMSSGDAGGMDRCITSDAVTETRGFGGVSGRRDHAMMLATAASFRDIVPTGFRLRIDKVVAEGDIVVIEFEGDAILSNGKPYCNQYAFIFSFRDGKIRHLSEYLCTVLADRCIMPLLAEQNALVEGD